MKRKIISFFTLLLALVCMFCASACVKNGNSAPEGAIEASVVKTEESLVVIKVERAEENVTLVQVMNYLQDKNEMTFTIGVDGMVSGVNGKANDTTDWQPFWYLYTSDAEMSNAEWGTVEYEGNTYGSSTLGAEALTVLGGEYYIWQYK